jgi:DNA-3-methyladenine glycosylase II
MGNEHLSKQGVLEAEKHLSQSCNVMRRLIAMQGHCPIADRVFQPFQTLMTAIISQQLSNKAADIIKKRVQSIIPSHTPDGLLSVSTEEIRAAGLSYAKARSIRELAQRVSDGRICLDDMQEQSEGDVIAALIELPGIGQWTIEMFLIFGLRRPDVFAFGDAGLQRAVRQLFGDDASFEVVSQPWRPYRSVASWYLWGLLDG